jgi:hypothetical protein
MKSSTIKQYLCPKLVKPAMARPTLKSLRRDMRHTIEYLFEAVEANAACAVVSVVTSFAMTGCLRLLLG